MSISSLFQPKVRLIKTEDEYKAELVRVLADDFELFPEVEGAFQVDGTRVRIDYMARPASPAISKGFKNTWFGIEVKSPGNEPHKQFSRALWQCVTYRYSRFRVAGRNVMPEFVMLYPNADDFDDGSKSYVLPLIQFVHKANVGTLNLSHPRERYVFNFGSSTYFRGVSGVSTQPNVATKKHVGSWT